MDRDVASLHRPGCFDLPRASLAVFFEHRAEPCFLPAPCVDSHSALDVALRRHERYVAREHGVRMAIELGGVDDLGAPRRQLLLERCVL